MESDGLRQSRVFSIQTSHRQACAKLVINRSRPNWKCRPINFKLLIKYFGTGNQSVQTVYDFLVGLYYRCTLHNFIFNHFFQLLIENR